MSELKEFVARKIDDGTCDPVPCIEVYSKSEADKVIADLEQKLEAAQEVLRLNKPEALYSNLETMSRLTHEKYVVERRERHQKYKRCLAMAYVEWIKKMTLCNHPESILYRRAIKRERKWKVMAQKLK